MMGKRQKQKAESEFHSITILGVIYNGNSF